ncbi:MAG TPA: HlyD family type I secretion periplasmic adaptor subunit [Rickettsiales bacterium]|nr:HlyD family type I secretion periplasmic adaptor subunit [Rickettsiales bacterium]
MKKLLVHLPSKWIRKGAEQAQAGWEAVDGTRRLEHLVKKAETALDIATSKSHKTEFLPAALEIIETPPSPAGRMVAGSIISFFVIALLWAIFGSVDIIATATGKIIPTGRIKLIQPLDSGVIRAIHVQDGQKVKAGDVLIEIDTTISEAERDRLKGETMQAMLDVARLKAAAAFESGKKDDGFVAPEGATDAQITLQETLLHNQLDEIRAKLDGLDRQITQHEGDRDSVKATIAKLHDSIPYLEKRSAARDYLAKKGYGSKLEALSTKQDLIEHQGDLQVQQGKLAEAEATVAALHEQRKQTEAEYRHTTLKDLAEAEQKADSLQQQLVQAAQKYRLQTLTAPVDGTVQQLVVHTVGGVVTPAQQLLAIVPATSHLEIEAMVKNHDIGFVHAGQKAEIKIDTFNFTEYGLLHGEVESVSRDSITQEKPPGDKKQPNGASDSSSEPAGQELLYAARVSLDKTAMPVDGQLVNLEPGMAVTVEIKTGSRHIIQYLLSPLRRHTHDAFREQ